MTIIFIKEKIMSMKNSRNKRKTYMNNKTNPQIINNPIKILIKNNSINKIKKRLILVMYFMIPQDEQNKILQQLKHQKM